MLEVKDIVRSTKEVLGGRFVLAEVATPKTGWEDGKATDTVAKVVFRVKALDACQTVEVGVKDPSIKPEAFPVGSELAFDGLRVSPYATREQQVRVSVVADAVRLAKPAADKSAAQ